MTGALKLADPAPQHGNVRVTREDWVSAATEVLIGQGIDQVKVLNLAEKLEVSRSSFYWYFKSRQALLDALLASWEASNTGSFVAACAAPADTITGAVGNLFRCFIDPERFEPQLDFAIRDWSRRSERVRRVVDQADAARLNAVQRMFERHGYAPADAEVRARILYYMQVGYYALELSEPLEQRLSYLRGYFVGFTGQEAPEEEIVAFTAYAKDVERRQREKGG